MKTSILAGALLCAASCAAPLPAPLAAPVVAPVAVPLSAQNAKNLIYNGDFEQTATGVPAGWTMWGPDQWKDAANFTRDTTQRHGGDASLRLFRPAGTNGYIASAPTDNSIVVQKGATYEFSFWAKSDKATRANFQVQALKSLTPFTDAGGAFGTGIDVSNDWQQYTFIVNESFDFFADTQPLLYLSFALAGAPDADQTLWIDDISVVQKTRAANVPIMLNPETVPYTPVNHRLAPGANLVINVDAARIVRPATRAATAVSFHKVNGYMNLPYNSDGKYQLSPDQEEKIRALRLPHTRFFALDSQSNSLNDAIDGAADTLDRTGIPQKGTVLEFENQSSLTNLTPPQWADGIKHSLSKGYGFHFWEISNEPYSQASKMYLSPTAYVNHVLEVSPAIRAADPKSQVGMAFDSAGGLPWSYQLLGRAAGHYDFICSHWYTFIDPAKNPFEMVVAGDNYRTVDRIARTNAVMKAVNPGRDVYQYDTEWGLHALTNEPGKDSTDVAYNGNIVGSMYRLVRLAYYAREDLVRGASAWEMFSHRSPTKWNAFALLPPEGDKTSMLYWTHRTFNEHLGEKVVEMSGTAPYYKPTTPSDVKRGIPQTGPLTPAITTLSADGKTLYVTVVNAMWDKSAPLQLNLANFPAKSISGIQLSNDDPNRVGLLEKKTDFVNDFPVALDGATVKCEIPPHSAVFLTLKR